MEEFILRIVGILCATIIACTIVIARKDDIDISTSNNIFSEGFDNRIVFKNYIDKIIL